MAFWSAELQRTVDEFPEFRPARGLSGPHLQTCLPAFLPHRRPRGRAALHRVELPDGDTLVLHDDRPNRWQPTDRAALLVHGLCGSHASSYMQRAAARLAAAGVRTFRLDLRGCGAGAGLARWPYHSGRSDDVLAAARCIERLCPGAPLLVVGYSLGGNLVLKALGHAPDALPANVERGLAVCPPVDLRGCLRLLQQPRNRHYDRYFAGKLYRQVLARRRRDPSLPLGRLTRPPRGLYEFDDCYTAPLAGYADAEEYYARCSSAQWTHAIRVPTLVIAAADDPLICCAAIEQAAARGPAVRAHVTQHGGHLGFLGRRSADPDRQWLDWRTVAWATAAAARPCPPAAVSSAGATASGRS